ncbi:sulfite exporter TauE/SafE family protein [Spirosoma pollinicola]|uniref:Sulfite exporter TauE/SafE family protein n=1 Tax=Spirosoma pollinicola TaxID=2057025 RepID=A0A2K8Z314_9BACT|nr:sulfite exporter TauE/SafE family protein [Spirosoma pollinicola]AUD04267.1 sulfite exporter TauE/SafE family protein [Spirosoma pollinicola]
MNIYTLWWAAALTTGLVGSLHCVGMCGPLAMAMPVGRLPRSQRGLAIGLYHGGRVLAYSGLGLLMGTIGQGILLAGLQRPVSIVAGLFLLAWTLVNRGLFPGLTMSRATRWVVQPMTRFLQNPTLSAFAGLGFLNGLLPCGFVYVALAGAVTTSSAATGAVYMALFGLGTVPALVSIRFLPSLFPAALRRRFTLFVPVVTVALGLLLLVRGVYNPTITDEHGHQIPVCHGSTALSAPHPH